MDNGLKSYTKESIINAQKKLEETNLRFNRKLSDVNYSPQNIFSDVEYRPELYTLVEFDNYQTTYFQNLIGVLRWIVELGWIDIKFDV